MWRYYSIQPYVYPRGRTTLRYMPPSRGKNPALIGVIVVVLLIITSFLTFFVFTEIFYSELGPYVHRNVEYYNRTVTVEDGGHYFIPLDIYDYACIEVNASSASGKKFDFYVMLDFEYQNVYVNKSLSFAAWKAWENISTVNETLVFAGDDIYYLVFDNSDIECIDDAVPNGTLVLSINLTVTQEILR